MKTKTIILSFLLLFSVALAPALAQKKSEPKPSPLAMATYKYKDTYIKVTYGAPSKKGRQIFGNLVPFGKVWRTGANEATEITFTQNVQIAGNLVPAGTYTLFTIPNAQKWTLLLNKELGQWGAYKYDEKKDVISSLGIPVPTEETEVFTINFEPKDGIVNLSMSWDRTKVSFPITLIEPASSAQQD
jgi:hypothetical protein